MSPHTLVLGCINILPCLLWASQVALVVKNLPANAGDVKEVGSIPGLGRTPGGGHGNPLSILAWSPCSGKESYMIEHKYITSLTCSLL